MSDEEFDTFKNRIVRFVDLKIININTIDPFYTVVIKLL